MLAGETAVGAFAARAVQTLDAIIRDAETALPASPICARSSDALHEDHAQALCEAAVTLANRGDAQAIVAVTRGGGTARRLSALRPRAPIFATTDRDDMARRLALYWGVGPVVHGDRRERRRGAGRSSASSSWPAAWSGPARRWCSSASARTSSRRDANYLKLQRL